MGLGVHITSQKVFKNGRGLGFSDTKERKSRIMPVTNRFGEKMRNYIKQPQVKK